MAQGLRLADGGNLRPFSESARVFRIRRGPFERLAPPLCRRLAGRFFEGAVERAERAEAEFESDGGDGLSCLRRIAKSALGGLDPARVDERREVALSQMIVDEAA